jgi:hypothetical protein
MAVAAPTGIIIGPLGRGEVTTRGQLVERHLRDAGLLGRRRVIVGNNRHNRRNQPILGVVDVEPILCADRPLSPSFLTLLIMRYCSKGALRFYF